MKVDITNIDLAQMVQKNVQLHGGAEKCGACPKCGGKDRFHLRRYGERDYFFCRQCHERRGDAIEYMRWLHGMTFKQACDALGTRIDTTHPIERVQAETIELAPPTAWQAAIRPLMTECAEYLHSDTPKARAALGWLHGRGLTDDTLRRTGIGYNVQARAIGDAWVAEGFTLPTVIFGDVWQVRIRRPPSHVGRTFTGKDGKSHEWAKYTGIKGNKQGLMGADDISRETQAVIVVGGEFDCYLAQQHAPAGVQVVTFGSESKKPHPRWLNIIHNVRHVFITMDNDQAGDTGAALWAALPQARRARVPHGKDITEFTQSGGDVATWLRNIALPAGKPSDAMQVDMNEEEAILEWLQLVGYECSYGGDGRIIAALPQQMS